MQKDKKYEEFRAILDSHPSTAPESENILKILKTLFTEDEIDIACTMSFRAKSPEDIALASGRPVDEVIKHLEAMADKAIIFSKKREDGNHYGLLPTIPGLFEFPFMKGGGTPMHKKLGELWEKYHAEGLGASFAGNPTPLMRVVPVEKSLESETVIHPYEEVANLLKNADYVAVTECACRVSVGKCDKPTDVCLIFNDPARFLVERGYAKAISHEEGLTVLDRAEEAGLVHTSNNSKDRANLICNCCSCCCTVLRGRSELDHPHAFVHSRFFARIDHELCTDCGICYEERCPMKAIASNDGLPVVNEEKCIGCGLCVSACPTEAIEFLTKSDEVQMPSSVQEMGINAAREKGRLEDFIKIMQR